MTSATERVLWMDRGRGIAVLAVIAWHVPAIPAVFGAEMPDWLRWVGNALSPYPIPFLLLLSGMLLRKSLQKPIARYYGVKIAYIGWPYIVWCCILLLVSPGADWLNIWFWLGGSYLWYLVVIGFCYVIGPIVRWVPPLVIASGSIVVLIVVDPSTNAVIRVLENAPYFFVGTALVPVMDRILRLPGWAVAIGGAVALAGGAYSATVLGFSPRIHLIPAVVSLIGFCCLMWVLNRPRRMPRAEWAGKNAMVFYVAHFPAMVVAWQLGVGQLPLALAYAILAIVGFGVPALLARYLADSLLFRLPLPRLWRDRGSKDASTSPEIDQASTR